MAIFNSYVEFYQRVAHSRHLFQSPGLLAVLCTSEVTLPQDQEIALHRQGNPKQNEDASVAVFPDVGC